jgi:predicted O-methyltransferase YrrM
MIVTEAVESYLLEARPAPDAVLAEMERHGARDGIPIVAPVTGALLSVLTAAGGVRRAVEVGTAIGVSTLHIARALPEGGTVVSFEIDEERQNAARSYLDRAGVAGRADLRLEDTAEGLAELEPDIYDLAFLDGQKADYPRHAELALPLLRPGGTLVVDNTLLSGSVADRRPRGPWSDDHIERMREFNASLLRCEDLQSVLLPVGDGVLIAVRR